MALKNLATCTPTEFVKQTAKIKNAVNNWAKLIDLAGIRAKKPQMETLPFDATAEERAAVVQRNAAAVKKQASANMSEIIDAALEKYPEETLKILALCCFVEPEDIDNHRMDEYLESVLEIATNKAVINFFTLLLQMQDHKRG